MAQMRFFTDEDIYEAVAAALRNTGFDAISTPEAGRRGETDESQLQWAALEGRAIVTFNVGHFADLHAQWMAQGRHHAGIVVSAQRSIGDLLRRLQHLGASLDSDAMRDGLESQATGRKTKFIPFKSSAHHDHLTIMACRRMTYLRCSALVITSR